MFIVCPIESMPLIMASLIKRTRYWIYTRVLYTPFYKISLSPSVVFMFSFNRGKKKEFQTEEQEKFSARKYLYHLIFSLSLFFSSFKIDSNQRQQRKNWPWNRVAESNFHATSGTFSPVFLSALTSRLVAALFSAHHRLEAAHVRVLPARNNQTTRRKQKISVSSYYGETVLRIYRDNYGLIRG